jgi:hypothetical protein
MWQDLHAFAYADRLEYASLLGFVKQLLQLMKKRDWQSNILQFVHSIRQFDHYVPHLTAISYVLVTIPPAGILCPADL